MTSIIGVGMTLQGQRVGDVDVLAREAASKALVDADIQPADVVAVLSANALAGIEQVQECVRGQAWLAGLGFGTTPIFNVENSCSSGSSALFMAHHVADSLGGAVLVVGAEQMCGFDRDLVSAGIHGGLDPKTRADAAELAGGVGTPLMAINAAWARRVLEEHDDDLEAVAMAAVKASSLGAANPDVSLARCYQLDQVLESPIVNAPLTRLMCSRFTDGAAAAVITPDGYRSNVRPIRVRAAVSIGGDGTMDFHDRLALGAAALWERAGIDPSELSLIELHDATSAEEIWASEITGVVRPGGGAQAIRSGETMPSGGGVAVNPSGGLVGRGHPIGATGLCQVYEVVRQLRGECGDRQVPNANLGATINAGGVMNRDFMAMCGFVLER